MNAAPVILFALAAAMGLWMAVRQFLGLPSPKVWGILHGTLAGLGILILAIILPGLEPRDIGLLALVLFVLAAVGGAYQVTRHVRGLPWPSVVVVAHGATAVAAFVILVVWLTGVAP